jgi:hypothetical protein
VVSSVDSWEGALFGEGLKGRKFPVSNATGYYRGSGRHTFDVEVIKKVAKQIQHWPVQAGDVWADDTGAEYHALRSSSDSILVRVYTTDDNIVSETNLKSKPGLKLVHRKGNNR